MRRGTATIRTHCTRITLRVGRDSDCRKVCSLISILGSFTVKFTLSHHAERGSNRRHDGFADSDYHCYRMCMLRNAQKGLG